jgi:hypothetical protein
MPLKAKAKIVKDVTQMVLARRTRMCNVLEYKGVLIAIGSISKLMSILAQIQRWCIAATHHCSSFVELVQETTNL